LFYQLEKLSFNSCPELSTFKNCQISNNTVKEISLTSNNAISSLDGLNAFPKLEKLIMNSCPNCGSTIVQVLNSYKHKIKHLDIKSCSAVNNTELMTYCQKNNIKLVVIVLFVFFCFFCNKKLKIKNVILKNAYNKNVRN
jgi:Zn finger protein HypA/HybF involved in hydrogenase expression